MGTLECGMACVNPADDPINCGGCGNDCGGGQLCDQGDCTCADQSLDQCGNNCVDLQTDPNHCGQCGNDCGFDETCEMGQCVCDSGDSCNGQCTDLQNDPDHCGDCGTQCDGELEICNGGQCECKPGLELCNGQCVQTSNDPQNCGGCDVDCNGDACLDGECVNDCGNLDECNGQCADVDTDPLNCGDCGQACDNDELCIDGNCEGFLAPWQTDCNMCPCDGCFGDFQQCCEVEQYGALCVDAGDCP